MTLSHAVNINAWVHVRGSNQRYPHLALVHGAPVDMVADLGSSGFNYIMKFH